MSAFPIPDFNKMTSTETMDWLQANSAKFDDVCCDFLLEYMIKELHKISNEKDS